MVAFGLYLVTPFCPTRLNCADDPTRLIALRNRVEGFGIQDFSAEELWRLALLRTTCRWASNWLRLVLLLRRETLPEIQPQANVRVLAPDFGIQYGVGLSLLQV